MARWIPVTLHLPWDAEIYLGKDGVEIRDIINGARVRVAFSPTNRQEANGLAIAFKQAARRLEDIGKGLE